MSASAGPKIVTDNLLVALDANNTKSYSLTSIYWFDLLNQTRFNLNKYAPFIPYDHITPELYSNINNTKYFQLTGLTDVRGSAIINAFDGIKPFTTDSATYSFFIEVDKNSVGYIFDNYRFNRRGGLYLNLKNNSDLTFGLTVETSSIEIDVPRFYLNNDWKLINIVLDREENFLNIYCNELLLSSMSISSFSGISINNQNICFGSRLLNYQGFPVPREFVTSAKFGAFFYYGKALSPIEISQNYNALKSRYEV